MPLTVWQFQTSFNCSFAFRLSLPWKVEEVWRYTFFWWKAGRILSTEIYCEHRSKLSGHSFLPCQRDGGFLVDDYEPDASTWPKQLPEMGFRFFPLVLTGMPFSLYFLGLGFKHLWLPTSAGWVPVTMSVYLLGTRSLSKASSATISISIFPNAPLIYKGRYEHKCTHTPFQACPFIPNE